MSRDYAISAACPHLTMEEGVLIADDRRTLQTRQPVGGAGSVRILVNDDFYIPQMGLSTPAQLFSSKSGPYDIKANEDTLTIQTPKKTQTVTLGVTSVSRYTADQVIQEFQRRGIGSVLLESLNGHLSISDISTVGPASFVKVTGTAATAFGFGAPKGVGTCGGIAYPWRVEGKNLYPGWSLYLRPDNITNRYPKFDYPVQGSPLFKVTYTVPRERCLRCGGLGWENDFRFDTEGVGILIENENLLYQACLKILLTDKGSNPYHPWYGTNLKSRIGSKALSGVASLINEDVRQALSKFQTVQESKAKYQPVSFKERLYAILSVETMPHAQDPTTFLVNVVVQNASSEPIELSIVFSVPGVISTLGSNGFLLGPSASVVGAPQLMSGM